MEWEEMDIVHVVTGHGNVVDKEHIIRVRQFFENLVSFLQQSIQNNLSFEDVISDENCPNYFEEDPEDWILTGIKSYYKKLQR